MTTDSLNPSNQPPEPDFACTDPADMLGRINELPRQIRDAWELVSGFGLSENLATDINGIVITGMGGSAIGGDLVAGLAGPVCQVPVVIHRSYGLPGWINENSLVIASSYSGGTEETLSAWDAATKIGARRIAVTTGGALEERARSEQAPALKFSYEAPPRAALGYSFTLILGLLARIGIIRNPGNDLEQAIALLEEAGSGWQPDVPEGRNTAKRLARGLEDALPVVFGAEHLAVVARRWTTQINENSKSWATWFECPELDHNLVVGLERPAGRHSGPHGGISRVVRACQLRSAHYDDRVTKRLAVTTDLLDKAGIETLDVEPPEGASRLGELLWTIWLGDYVSYYLACLYGEDPTPVKPIDYLKHRLAEK